jgi:hypothetical protein
VFARAAFFIEQLLPVNATAFAGASQPEKGGETECCVSILENAHFNVER